MKIIHEHGKLQRTQVILDHHEIRDACLDYIRHHHRGHATYPDTIDIYDSEVIGELTGEFVWSFVDMDEDSNEPEV